jgi:hypothetical protein
MSYQNKKNWVKYKRVGEIIEITIRDGGGQNIGNFKCVNNKDWSRVVKLIKDKFGYEINEQDIEKEKDKEKNWLEKDWEW